MDPERYHNEMSIVLRRMKKLEDEVESLRALIVAAGLDVEGAASHPDDPSGALHISA